MREGHGADGHSSRRTQAGGITHRSRIGRAGEREQGKRRERRWWGRAGVDAEPRLIITTRRRERWSHDQTNRGDHEVRRRSAGDLAETGGIEHSASWLAVKPRSNVHERITSHDNAARLGRWRPLMLHMCAASRRECSMLVQMGEQSGPPRHCDRSHWQCMTASAVVMQCDSCPIHMAAALLPSGLAVNAGGVLTGCCCLFERVGGCRTKSKESVRKQFTNPTQLASTARPSRLLRQARL